MLYFGHLSNPGVSSMSDDLETRNRTMFKVYFIESFSWEESRFKKLSLLTSIVSFSVAFLFSY